MTPFSFFQRHRRRIAGAMLALLLQSLAWGAGAAGFADVLESESTSAIHEQGCLDDGSAPAGTQAPDNHCNEACHFWSQFQIVFATDAALQVAASPVLNAKTRVYVSDNRTTPPFRPPRASLPA